MPRQTTITRSWETKGILWTRKHRREYRVTYADDSDERAEAVTFFGKGLKGLSPALNIPDSLKQMSERSAQEYLDAHPVQLQWNMLILDRCATFVDDDLRRLKYFPELERLHLFADHLTDRGVSFIPLIPKLRHLLIYSPNITDRCLEDIARLRWLKTIDLQGSHLISRGAFDALAEDLPDLEDIYPPLDRPLSEIYAGAQKAQNKHMGSNG